jgi:hypothetical protein
VTSRGGVRSSHPSTEGLFPNSPGIEAGISYFKPRLWRDRCTWRGLDHFNGKSRDLAELDPARTDEFFAAAIPVYKSGVMSPKDLELLSIAFDAS